MVDFPSANKQVDNSADTIPVATNHHRTMETNPFSSKTTDALKRELLNVTEMLNEKR